MERRGIRRANVLGIERDEEGRDEKWTHECAIFNVESLRNRCLLMERSIEQSGEIALPKDL